MRTTVECPVPLNLVAMMSFRDEPLRRAEAYAAVHGLALVEELGFGVHGIVFYH